MAQQKQRTGSSVETSAPKVGRSVVRSDSPPGRGGGSDTSAVLRSKRQVSGTVRQEQAKESTTRPGRERTQFLFGKSPPFPGPKPQPGPAGTVQRRNSQGRDSKRRYSQNSPRHSRNTPHIRKGNSSFGAPDFYPGSAGSGQGASSRQDTGEGQHTHCPSQPHRKRRQFAHESGIKAAHCQPGPAGTGQRFRTCRAPQKTRKPHCPPRRKARCQSNRDKEASRADTHNAGKAWRCRSGRASEWETEMKRVQVFRFWSRL